MKIYPHTVFVVFLIRVHFYIYYIIYLFRGVSYKILIYMYHIYSYESYFLYFRTKYYISKTNDEAIILTPYKKLFLLFRVIKRQKRIYIWRELCRVKIAISYVISLYDTYHITHTNFIYMHII